MRTKLFITVSALTLVVALGIAGFAFAQTNQPPQPYNPENAQQFWGMRGRGSHPMGVAGMMGGFGFIGEDGYGPIHEYMVEAFAEALDLTPAELQNRLAGGEHMWEIAISKGLSTEQIYELMSQAHNEALKAMVAAGNLTQEQADWMHQHMGSGYGQGFGPGGCPMDGDEDQSGAFGPRWHWEAK